MTFWLLNRNVISDSEIAGTIARQAPLFVGFPRQEYWSGLPFPSPGFLVTFPCFFLSELLDWIYFYFCFPKFVSRMTKQSDLLSTTCAYPQIVFTQTILLWDSQLKPETEAWTQKMIRNHWPAL